MFYRCMKLLLCLLISITCWSEPPQTLQRAGEIAVLVPSAERNSKPAKAKDAIDWNDLLKTQHTGRLRAALTDGSTLSMGSDTQMRVLQHDPKLQETSIELGVGALRSRVVKLMNPGGKFEVRTPQAIIGVIGTDFYVGVSGNRTVVVCYSGTLSVTPTGSAQIKNQSSGVQAVGALGAVTVPAGAQGAATVPAGAQGAATVPAGAQGAVTVPAGSMVEVGEDVPPVVKPTPRTLQDASIAATDVEVPPMAPAHALRYVRSPRWQIIVGATAGIDIGFLVHSLCSSTCSSVSASPQRSIGQRPACR